MRLMTLAPYLIVLLCLYGALQQQRLLYFSILITGSIFFAMGGRQRMVAVWFWMKPLANRILGLYPRGFSQKPAVSSQNVTVVSTQKEILRRYKKVSDSFEEYLCGYLELYECCSNKIRSIHTIHRSSSSEGNTVAIHPNHALDELLAVDGRTVQLQESHHNITVNADLKRNRDHLEQLNQKMHQLSSYMLNCIESGNHSAFERHYMAYQQTVKELKLAHCDVLKIIHDFFQNQCPNDGLIHDIGKFIDITNCIGSSAANRGFSI